MANELTALIRSFKEAFHGKGVDAYSSPEARKKFARSLLRLADKLFWAPIAVLLATGLTSRTDVFIGQCVVATVFFACGVYVRHHGLVIYDSLPATKRRTRRPAVAAAVTETVE